MTSAAHSLLNTLWIGDVPSHISNGSDLELVFAKVSKDSTADSRLVHLPASRVVDWAAVCSMAVSEGQTVLLSSQANTGMQP